MDGTIIFAQRQLWQKHFISERTDHMGKRFGNKSTTLEAVGLLLPLLAIPDRLQNQHIVFRLDNMGCVFGFENHKNSEDHTAALILKTVHMVGAALGSVIHVEHLPRRSDWLSKMVDNMSRVSTTSDIESLTLERFKSIGNSHILEDWMKKPRASYDWPYMVTKYVCSKL